MRADAGPPLQEQGNNNLGLGPLVHQIDDDPLCGTRHPRHVSRLAQQQRVSGARVQGRGPRNADPAAESGRKNPQSAPDTDKSQRMPALIHSLLQHCCDIGPAMARPTCVGEGRRLEDSVQRRAHRTPREHAGRDRVEESAGERGAREHSLGRQLRTGETGHMMHLCQTLNL
eukprot:1800464-Rhodomonas_salina.2